MRCKECKHLIYKEDAQEVEVMFSYSFFPYRDTAYKYYCPEHKKPYDIVKYIGQSKTYYKHNTDEFVEFVEVDEKGKRIK